MKIIRIGIKYFKDEQYIDINILPHLSIARFEKDSWMIMLGWLFWSITIYCGKNHVYTPLFDEDK